VSVCVCVLAHGLGRACSLSVSQSISSVSSVSSCCCAPLQAPVIVSNLSSVAVVFAVSGKVKKTSSRLIDQKVRFFRSLLSRRVCRLSLVICLSAAAPARQLAMQLWSALLQKVRREIA